MSNFGALAQFIIAALLAVAMINPGLDAVQKAIEGLKTDRESAAVEACYVEVERARGSRILTAFEKNQKQGECQTRLFEGIKTAYNPALYYICKIRQLVTLSNDNPNATSAAIETSAATPTYTSQCSIYDNTSTQ